MVEARVAEPGLAGVTRRLEPMLIADTVTYGNYFQLFRRWPLSDRSVDHTSRLGKADNSGVHQ